MIRKPLFAVALLSAIASTTVVAAPVVDGILDASYGAAKSTVTFAAGTPESNFGSPTPFTDAVTYSIYLQDVGGNYYGLVKSSGGTGVGSFANLYFDIDPANGNGSDIGFEVTNSRAFVAGGDGSYATIAGFQFALSGDGTGIEFVASNSAFTQAIAGLTYGAGQQFAASNGDVVLRLSQSFGYSVGGGPLYGDNRLGRVTLDAGAAAVPEPSELAVLAIGLVALALARRRNRSAR